MYLGHAGSLPNGDFAAIVPTKDQNEDNYFVRLINLSAWARILARRP